MMLFFIFLMIPHQRRSTRIDTPVPDPTLCRRMGSTIAYADETVMVEDNSLVACVASEKDLTRISLIGDEFASVSKVQPTNPLDDFSVVNEPTRGDIYLSVPEGFRLKVLSFFRTTKKGYVYKFGCPIGRASGRERVCEYV